MSSIQILSDFKSNLIQFFDELIEQFPSESELVLIRIFLNDQVPIESVMNYFIKDILPHKELVKARDGEFFMSNNILFGRRLDKTKPNYFKNLWRSTQLDAQDREVIWKWFDNFIKIAEKYMKAKSAEAQ